MDITSILNEAIPLTVAAALVLLALAVAIRVLTPVALRALAKRRMSAREREGFALKESLLRHGDIVDFVAPLKDFQRKLGREEKKKNQLHWVSAYPSAVKASKRRHRYDPYRSVTLARAQIKEAARHITVATLPEDMQPANAGPEHFAVSIALNGKPKSKIVGLIDLIEAQLEVHSIAIDDTADRSEIRFIAHLTEPESHLAAGKIGAQFFVDHPATRLASLPVALTESGRAFELPTAHGIIYGVSGSGKGSAFQAMIRQTLPFARRGEVKLFGIDPKNMELRMWAYSTLFEDYATETSDIEALIASFHRQMKERTKSVVLDWDSGDMKRRLPYTTETPLMLLFIDELFSMIVALQRTKSGKLALGLLDEILAQGRAVGFVVVGATQIADSEILKWIRPNIATWTVLRIGSRYFNDAFLGDGAAARGFDATAIVPATEQTNYATAGIGYSTDESGEVVRIRFPFLDDREIAALVREDFRSTPLGNAGSTLSMQAENGDAWRTWEDDSDGEAMDADADWIFEDVDHKHEQDSNALPDLI